jgi:hypothetical protein
VTSFAGPHTYWRVEDSKGTEKRLIHGVMDIPVGTTTDSDLTSLFIASDDGKTSYLLQMGPWSWDTCENYGPVETKGSTKVRITRTSATTFTTIAPPGTVGVLHDVQNLLKPVPVGLYYMSFEIRYTVDATP